MSDLDKIETVKIENDGIFKYILIEAKGSSGEKKLVWGDVNCEYHMDVFEKCEDFIKKNKLNVKLNCLGGGRINHLNSEKKILIYGYSVGYGKADHSVTQSILQEVFKDYHIDYNDDGY